MCGEDGIKRAVYNMKGGHAEKGSEHREKQREDSERNLERKELYLFKRKIDCCISSDPSINVRLNIFILRRLI